jgi:long-chain acyl-CoA synthetase
MLGYYKNEEATRESLDKDGWYHTGDLGTMDYDGNVFINGRSKNMLLGSSGQNIYPEEIEDKVNNLPGVVESLVVGRQGKIVALVYPDEKYDLQNKSMEELMNENLATLNAMLPAYSKVSSIVLVDKEFEKTPKRSIRRFLYS